MILYRKAKKCEANQIAKICTDSFAQYPLYRTIRDCFTNEKNYYQFLYRLQSMFVKVIMKHHALFVGVLDDKIVSIAMLENLEKKPIGLWEYINGGGLKLLGYISLPKTLSYLGFLMRTTSACDKIKNPKWHLFTLAVNTSYQGKQLGSKIIQDCIIPYVKKNQGKLLTLTTNTELNRKFYIKNGFIEFDKRSLHWKKHSVENWSFHMVL